MPLRERLLLDKNWRFHFGDIRLHDCRHMFSKVRTASHGPIRPDYDDSQWRTVDVPHDFVVENPFSETQRVLDDPFPLAIHDTDENAIQSHGYLPGGVGWYRKHFALNDNDRGKRLHLVFDGLYRDAHFWLNGLYLGRHHSGYTECRFDISDLVYYGNENEQGNVLAVRLETRRSEGWFYEGGGIYRHVWLEKTAPVAVAPHGTFVWTRHVSPAGPAELEVRTTLRNHTDADAECHVKCTVQDGDGTEVAESANALCVPAGAAQEEIRNLTVPEPRLWDLQDPHLYVLVTEVSCGNTVVDRCKTRFGIRTIRFDADQGFFLNGKNVKLKGVCVHQNHAGVGVAMPDKLFEYRIRQLQKLGCNAYRCAHYPQAPELLDACDRLGMLVMDETRSFSSAPEFMGQHEIMIRRDRNHPCIVIYCMANEESIQNTPIGERMMQSIRRLAKRLDPSRPLTTANNEGEFWGRFASKHLDVQGCNYCPEQYDSFHRNFPTQPIVATETSSRLTTRGVYRHDPARGHVDAYDRTDCGFCEGRMPAEAMWRGIAERPFVSGAFVWTGIDYKGETVPYHWPTVASHFGMLDSCCFPKDIAYFFRTWWTQTDQMHLFPHWNWTQGDVIDVWCYARHEAVELFLNGVSQGVREMPAMSHVSWKVPYEAGAIEARGYRDGHVVATRRIETTGPAVALALATDHAAIRADAQDLAVVNVTVVDARGRTVPTACNPLRFEVTGNARILGVGNGDPASHEPDRASCRRAFNGLCQVLVQSTTEAGTIRLTARSEGLSEAELPITAEECRLRPGL